MKRLIVCICLLVTLVAATLALGTKKDTYLHAGDATIKITYSFYGFVLSTKTQQSELTTLIKNNEALLGQSANNVYLHAKSVYYFGDEKRSLPGCHSNLLSIVKIFSDVYYHKDIEKTKKDFFLKSFYRTLNTNNFDSRLLDDVLQNFLVE